VILAIQAIRPAAKADELVEIAVIVEVGPRVGLAAIGGEEVRLNQLEAWRILEREGACVLEREGFSRAILRDEKYNTYRGGETNRKKTHRRWPKAFALQCSIRCEELPREQHASHGDGRVQTSTRRP